MYRLSLCLLIPGLVVLVSFVGCQSGEPGAPAVERLNVPAGPGSGQPHLHVDEAGQVWMSWVEPVDSVRHALRYAAFDGAAWSTPKTAATGADWFVNWADVPSIHTLPGGRFAAHYLQSSGSNVYAYDVRITQTDDGGAWQAAVTPHRDGTPTEHGFVSLLPWAGDLLAVWLDGRAMEASEEGHGHGGGAMTLRSALLTPSGAIEREALLDARTCECCPTSAVRTADGALVAYRDRTENEVRNVSLVRFDGEAWSQPYVLHDDGWRIEGCPVNGPALAADGDRAAAAWFTAADGTPRVNVSFSGDGGRRFGSPVVVDDKGPTGRVDVALLDDGSALVSWIGNGHEGSALRVRHVRSDGAMGDATSVATVASGRGTGMPRMVRAGDYLYVAWVDVSGDADQVQVTRASVRDFM